MGLPITVDSARTAELAPAFRLLFQHLSPDEQDSRLATALQLVNRGDLDPAGLLVARTVQGLLGAILCQVVPGASGLVWPPQVGPELHRRQCEDLLVRHASVWLRQHGAKLAQSLLAPREVSLAGPLVRNGFARVTQLCYMRRPLGSPAWLPEPSDLLTFHSYAEGSQELFHQTLLRTYEGTLDCPEVNGVRAVEEIIVGHRAQGVHDPGRWWLVLDRGLPAGVLMLTEMPDWRALDISYVGVVPEYRRRGLGRELMHQAFAEAQAAGVEQLTLSVDERNLPAWNLYLGLGFEPYDQRGVYLAIWAGKGPA